MKTIDFHAHILTPAFREGLAKLGIDPLQDDGFPLPAWSAEGHLAFMDEAGIDLAVLTAPSPHIHNGDDEASLQVARAVNDESAAVCAAHPDRFAFAACVPLPYVEGAIEEAARALDQLAAVGVKVATNNNGVYLGDPSLDPFFEAMNERGALVIMHPCRAKQSPRNCVTGGVAGILASKGMMDKVDVYGEAAGLWFDLAGDPEPVALDMLRMVAPDDHIVYGSDYPHSPAPVVVPKKKSLYAQERFVPITQSNNGEALLAGEAR